MFTRTLFVYLLAGALALAGSRIEGKVVTEGPADSYFVELYENSGNMLADRVPVGRDGSFTLTAGGTQLYEVRVVTGHGDRVVSEHMYLRAGQPLELRLPRRPESRRAPGGAVSMARLAHRPAKVAMKLARQADSLAGDGDWAGSVRRLERVVEEDPRWFEAWNNLGSRLLKIGRYTEAADAFRRAAGIDPNQSAVHSNLGLTYLFLRESKEAAKEARRARELEPGSAQAAYVEALAMLQLNEKPEEAVALLRAAAPTLPRARLAVAEWHCRTGELQDCAAELKVFLKTPRGPNHAAAEKWLGEVKKQLNLRSGLR